MIFIPVILMSVSIPVLVQEWESGRIERFRKATLWGKGAGWEQEGGTHPHEAHYLKLDYCAKAKARLGWAGRRAGI